MRRGLQVTGGVLAILPLLWWALFRGPYRQVEPLPQKPILDLHTHVAGLGYGDSGCYVNPVLRDSYKFDFFFSALGVDLATLERDGDRVLVARLAQMVEDSTWVQQAVVLALDGVIRDGQLDKSATQVYVPNRFVAEETSRYPQLLYGASINPKRPDALARLEAAHEAGAVLLKWIPCIMDFDPGDTALEPFYRRMAALQLPLLSHTGMERSFHESNDTLCDPLRLALPLRLGVTVIAAHAAATGEEQGQSYFERLAPLVDAHPNLLIEISSLTQINKVRYLEQVLAQSKWDQRLVYGSDWPVQFFPLVSPLYHWRQLGPGQIQDLFAEKNVLDRDVLLKQALGVPQIAFENSQKVIMAETD